MDCRKTQEWIEAEVDGAITPKARRSLDKHVESCETCRTARDDSLFSQEQFEVVGLEEVPAKLSQELDARLGKLYSGRRLKNKGKINGLWNRIVNLLAKPRTMAIGITALGAILVFALIPNAPNKSDLLGIPVLHVAGAPKPVESPTGLALHRGAYLVTRVKMGSNLRSVAKNTVLTLAKTVMVVPEKTEVSFPKHNEKSINQSPPELRSGHLWIASAPHDTFQIQSKEIRCLASPGSFFEIALRSVRVIAGSVRVNCNNKETLVRAGQSIDLNQGARLLQVKQSVSNDVIHALKAVLPMASLISYIPSLKAELVSADLDATGQTATSEQADTDHASTDDPVVDETSTSGIPSSGEDRPQVNAIDGLMGDTK